MSAIGDIVYRGATVWKRLTGNTSTTRKVLAQTGDGVNSTAPVWTDEYSTTAYVDEQIAAIGGGGGVAQNSFLVSGGQIAWVQNYDFIISAASYYIQGVLYSSPESSITLDAADPTDDRIDVIAVDDTGTVIKVTGTAAPNPSEPDIDPGTQLKLGLIIVPAASTEPSGAAQETLYYDNAGGPTEWNWTNSGASFNVNSTNNPKSPSTKDIEGTSVTAGHYAQGTIPSSNYNPANASLLVIYIRSKATWANNRGLTVSLRTSGVLQGVSVNINRTGTFGFDSSVTGSYQLVAIPVSMFAIPAGTTITQIRIAAFGNGHGFYLDDIYFQENATSQTPIGITQDQADARYAQRANNLSDLTSASSARTNLGLGSLATASSVDLSTGQVTGDLPFSKLVQASAAGVVGASAAGDYTRLGIGTGLAISGGDLTASGSGGTVTTTGSPAAGELTRFSGASSITTGNLTGDVSTSGSLATTIGNNKVGFAQMADITTDRLIGRDTAATPGDPEEISLDSTLEFTGSQSIRRAALTGDVTASAGSNATTIANNAVTYAKLQDISATSRVLGRKSSGSGDCEECTLSEILDFIGSAAQGDILYRGASNWSRLAAGTSGKFLQTNGGSANPSWESITGNVATRTIVANFDGGGAALTANSKLDVYVPYSGTITAVTMLADQSGSAVVDIWKVAYASYPATVSNSITASAKPTISSATKSQDNTLTGWTTSISAGDCLRFNVDSATTITRLQLTLTISV